MPDEIEFPPARDDGEAAETAPRRRSLRALEWLNFFLADVQTGLGPFLAAYLAGNRWSPARVGMVLSLGGFVAVALQTPAGAVVDAVRAKRGIPAAGVGALAAGALLLAARTDLPFVCTAQVLIGTAAPFLGPTLAAITLGLVGPRLFDRQFGRNQAFNSAGNVFTALLVIAISMTWSNRAIFLAAALLSIPAWLALAAIAGDKIDNSVARGAPARKGLAEAPHISAFTAVLADRRLLSFLACCMLFHLANAAMLPQLGELLSRRDLKSAEPFMSACVLVTQTVIALSAAHIAKFAGRLGRRPLLLMGFGVLPIRGALYAMVSGAAPLIAIQVLDGIDNAVFVVVSVLVIADLTRNTGRFNLAQGALATVVGVGAALSTTVGGILMQRFGYRVSFFGLAGIAFSAFVLLWFTFQETGTVRKEA